jgi:hypothetical protein
MSGIRPVVLPGFDLRYRPSTGPADEPQPLPPLPPVPSSAPGPDPVLAGTSAPKTPNWSPLAVALPLFAVVWACFAALGARVTPPAATDVTALAEVLAGGAAVVALVLVTLAVAHLQVSGRWPRPAAGAVVALGLGQALVAAALGSDSRSDLWPVGAWLFALIGVTVPLAWVGGQFQSGVRHHRVERHASLTASLIERARRQAHQTVQSVYRHDARSMLFAIDGTARTLVDPRLPEEQRKAFSEILTESVERLGALIDVRAEEIQPFALDGVARAVVHAERRAGRAVTAEIPSPLTAMGRAADVAAVLRTLFDVTGRNTDAALQLRAETVAGVVVIRVEAQGADELPLLSGNWEEVSVESFKPGRTNDEDLIDLYVATRLLSEQGADLWSAAGRARFAVRLPVAADNRS